ncbi:MAG TPA: DinB family protein [Pyrinomonadaceae bacterium]|nr:DinB family protein [Pyrinomonadaceae bacterium]HMP64540.1 DinB family protein [Pyrinomonadaceae bacterium]
MKFETIEDVYETNDRVRQKLKELLSETSDEQCYQRPEEGKWSIAEIVEHLQMVEHSMVRICAKLLKKAKANGNLNDGNVTFSRIFTERGDEIARMKVEAPEFVRPGGQKSVAESLSAMDEAREMGRELKELFERYNGNIYKFRHPYFGELSAIEWLGLIGSHEMRHIRQIKNILKAAGAGATSSR